MEEEQIEKAVLAYLKKKGYKAAELAFQDDQQSHRSASSASSGPSMEPVVLNQILFYSRSDNDPGQYSDGYKKLRSWVHSSLDLYKNELLRILYPIFVHSYMDLVSKGFAQEARAFFQSYREDHEAMHLHDLQKLEGLISPEHLKENDIAKTLRENKVNIKLCQYSFELLLQYLHSTDSMLMLGIVNAHINLKVFPGQPSVLPEEEDSPILPGKMQEALDSINQKEIYWGVLEDSIEDRFEKEQTADADKAALEAKEIEGEDGKKRASDGKQGLGNKKLKKDKATSKDLKLEQSRSKVPPVKPELTLPITSEESEKRILEDLRNRVRLGSNALPSVCFYTFVNTHNSLSCSSISADGAQLVGGFSDSSLKVWNMEKLGERDISSENGINIGNKDNRSTYVHLTGHSGPVYGAQFSPDSDFLLSASADCTVRLWSLKLKTNLVCYKGHNYPVWDVQFSPVGHYFVSASHDRTARIWSMDRMQPLRILAGHLSDVDCVQWHVNCNYIATGSSDKTVRLWDVQTGECMRVFAGHRGMVVSLVMSPDGRYMASGDEDGAIMMWDLATTKCVSPLLGHTGSVWSLAFSGEGSLLASGSADNTLRLWDVNASSKASRTADKSGTVRRLRLLKTLPTKSTPVHALRFSRRNLLFAAGPFSSPKLLDKI